MADHNDQSSGDDLDRRIAEAQARQHHGVTNAQGRAETRGWARSQAIMIDSTNELRAHGIKVDRVSQEFDQEFKRLGEKFSREWVRSVGNEANQIFIRYYSQ